MNSVKFLSLILFALILPGNFSYAATDDSDVPQISNPAALELLTQAVYKKFSNFTSLFNNEILNELDFCIKDVDAEWNAAFNFSRDTEFLSNCIQRTKEIRKRERKVLLLVIKMEPVLDRETKFEIEGGSLEGKYKDWQKKLHPDLVHTKSEKEREYAAEQSARVIDAYRTLRNPLSRALYIMRLEGVEVDEEKTISEGELLAEIMEIREAVEEAVDTRELDQIKTQMQHKLRHWSDSFANAFRSKNYDEALRSIQRMTYYDRVNEEIVKKL